MRYLSLFAIALAASLSGCGAITSTTDAIAQTAQVTTDAITQGTAATSDGTTGLSKSPDAELARATAFVKSQLAFLRRDAAAGEGENLDTLAGLMGESDKPAFGRWMQAHYQSLFDTPRSPEELVNYIATQRS